MRLPMLDRTPHAQFIAPRLARALQRLSAVIWRVEEAPLRVWQTVPTHEHRRAADVGDGEFAPLAEPLPMAWGRAWQQCWWRVELPAASGDAHRYLRWRDQGEATVYAREGDAWTPWYGIDPGHHYAPLPKGAREVRIESICARTGIWVTGEQQGIGSRGSLFEGAYLAARDDEAWHAYHDLDVLVGVCKLLYGQALPRPYNPDTGNEGFASGGASFFSPGGYRTPLEVAPPLLRLLIARLDRAIDALDRDGPAALRKLTAAILADFPAEPWATEAILTGHAHIDLVWKWPERVGDFKAVHSFATVNRLMDAYPDLHFGYSQPASY